ncbi:hypothetical protein [Amycolatopsis sp. NPDC059657]|uniref:hypothetical protein n=1 Tax=Amycolatopsis sp. NPDC059657 TaxID=3346899 RepID=UPI00366A69B6
MTPVIAASSPAFATSQRTGVTPWDQISGCVCWSYSRATSGAPTKAATTPAKALGTNHIGKSTYLL